MNFLAHVFLANGDPDSIVGQLCGDFVRGGSLDSYPQAIVHGIRVHRAVDSFTDQHPLNRKARSLFSKPHRRYAGIICDVLYDHFLAGDWDNYSSVPLAEYAELVIGSLQRQHTVLPQRLRDFLPYLESERVLQNNVSRQHIELTLQRLSKRRNSMAPLATAAPAMWAIETELHELFNEFFPELISHAREVQALVRSNVENHQQNASESNV